MKIPRVRRTNTNAENKTRTANAAKKRKTVSASNRAKSKAQVAKQRG